MARLLIIICLACVLGQAPAVVGQPVPMAPGPEATPFAPQYRKHQSLALEAETKARRHQKFAQQDPGKTASMDRYDVLAYDLALDLYPEVFQLEGVVTMRARVVGGAGDPALDQVDLHLGAGMAVSSVQSAGQTAGFSREGDILTIVLDRPYLPGEELTVTVTYGGNPEGDSFGWDYYAGAPLIWTLSEPYGARQWWPCKDVNTDKADTVDLRVTVPASLMVASNGLLIGTSSPVADRVTYHWRENYPIVTYLVSLAIHPYSVLEDSYTGLDGQVMQVRHYIVPGTLNQAEAGFPVTVDMLEAFAAAYGEYPFIDEKYGHAHFPWGGGMEHQTLTSLNYGAFGQGIIAHELAHQWWGDLVTCADFGHIWLNEGFATWSEAYWREINEGVDAYHEEMALARYTGDGTIFVENPGNFWTIFDYNLSYLKASWVPHMLRRVLGDEDFFAGLAHYRALYGYGSATTEQFRDAMEAVSGRELDSFFQQWIYGSYFPRYRYDYSFAGEAGARRLQLKLTQVQTNTGIFDMPVDVRVYSPGGAFVDFTVPCDRREQWYTLDVPDDALFIALDPENWILCETIPGGTSGVESLPARETAISGAWPNPFNPRTTVQFTMGEPAPVELVIHDVSGRRIRTLLHESRSAGEHQVIWDGKDDGGQTAAAGVYFARLSVHSRTSVAKLTLLK